MKFKGIEIELDEMYEFTKKIVDEVLESELILDEEDADIFIQMIESNLKLTFNTFRKKGLDYGHYIKIKKSNQNTEEIK